MAAAGVGRVQRGLGELPPGPGLEAHLLGNLRACVVRAVDEPVGTFPLVLEDLLHRVDEGAAEGRVGAVVVLTQVGTGQAGLE